MQVVVAGAHGRIARLLHPLLIGRGHAVRGLVRNPDQVGTLRVLGVEPVPCDLEQESDLSTFVGRADAVIFAAGAGPGSGAGRKRSLDRDGALKLIEAARANGVRRYVMVSAMNPERPRGDEAFRAYLAAKAEADAALRDSGLDWTIVRPGRLTDVPGSGRVTIARALERADIPRADVAVVLAEVLELPATAGLQFDVVGGDTPAREALEAMIPAA